MSWQALKGILIYLHSLIDFVILFTDDKQFTHPKIFHMPRYVMLKLQTSKLS